MSADFPGEVWVRLSDPDGRLTPVEIYVHGDEPLTANTLRQLPLGRIEAWVNGPDLAANVRGRMTLPGSDLYGLAGHYATPFGKVTHWVARSMHAQLPHSGEPQAPPRAKRGKLVAPWDPDVAWLSDHHGENRDHGDLFYERVAKTYAQLHQFTRAPARTIAEAAGVPASTARRWVKEARRRGFLPPGRPGKAG